MKIIGPEPQEQEQEQMQEQTGVSDTTWYAHPSVIGPIAGATIIAIIGPLIVWKVKNRKK